MRFHSEQMAIVAAMARLMSGIFALTLAAVLSLCGINRFTFMPAHSHSQAKRQALKASGTFNARADQVRHKLFEQAGFFDPEDLLQLKYEILRALEKDGYPIAQAAGEFGLSRPTIYQAQGQFAEGGLEGLLPRKRGPKSAHKLTSEVRQYLEELSAAEPELDSSELARRVRQRFKIKLHPRTIEKALKTKGKRGPQMTS
jgi:transposase